MCRGQLAVGYHAGATRTAVDPGKCHGAGLGSQLRLEAEVDRVLCDGPGRVGGRLPREMGTFHTLYASECMIVCMCVCTRRGRDNILYLELINSLQYQHHLLESL